MEDIFNNAEFISEANLRRTFQLFGQWGQSRHGLMQITDGLVGDEEREVDEVVARRRMLSQELAGLILLGQVEDTVGSHKESLGSAFHRPDQKTLRAAMMK
eukprot:gene8926-2943_t